MNSSNILIFTICAFALGGILIMSKDNIPPKMKRGLALTAVILVAAAFGLIIYSFLA
ncbi:hypothetical protein ACFQ3W_10765 [Paenibacillus puldeungensis]|uniref:Signal transduction histidine kinase n=1 Tax=Paenibacillus puldeungensis TaxID=696536 RepID=A0ABW3RWV4_9BACL